MQATSVLHTQLPKDPKYCGELKPRFYMGQYLANYCTLDVVNYIQTALIPFTQYVECKVGHIIKTTYWLIIVHTQIFVQLCSQLHNCIIMSCRSCATQSMVNKTQAKKLEQLHNYNLILQVYHGSGGKKYQTLYIVKIIITKASLYTAHEQLLI